MGLWHHTGDGARAKSSKVVLKDDKQDHMFPIDLRHIPARGTRTRQGGKSPEGTLRSSVMYDDTQSLGSGLIISRNDDDSEISFVGWTGERSRKEQRNGRAGSP